ncbi:hypothetical protein SK128_022995, partial [Halocaridina rubra]
VLSSCIDRCAPLVTREIFRPPAPWITDDIKNIMKERDKLQNEVKLQRDNIPLREKFTEHKKQISQPGFGGWKSCSALASLHPRLERQTTSIRLCPVKYSSKSRTGWRTKGTKIPTPNCKHTFFKGLHLCSANRAAHIITLSTQSLGDQHLMLPGIKFRL